jgi:hypothetical protein
LDDSPHRQPLNAAAIQHEEPGVDDRVKAATD